MKQHWLAMVGLPLFLSFGCTTSYTHQCGDAKIHQQRIHISLLAGPDSIYQIELPAISLAVKQERVFKVRNARGGSVPDTLYMALPQGDVCASREPAPKRNLPWEKARLTLTYREVDGSLIARGSVRLGDLKWKYYKGSRIFGWHAESVIASLFGNFAELRTKAAYDVTFTIETLSDRKSDMVQLKGQRIRRYGKHESTL